MHYQLLFCPRIQTHSGSMSQLVVTRKFAPQLKLMTVLAIRRLQNTDMWRNHYSTLLNSVISSVDKDRVLFYLNDCSNEYSVISISVDNVSNGIKHVKLVKSCGVDGLSAEHFIYAGNYVKVYLSILFTSFISHGYLPNSFMKSAIIHLIKNKTGDTNDKNNNGLFALVAAMLKIFELCLSEKLNGYLTTSDNECIYIFI